MGVVRVAVGGGADEGRAPDAWVRVELEMRRRRRCGDRTRCGRWMRKDGAVQARPAATTRMCEISKQTGDVTTHRLDRSRAVASSWHTPVDSSSSCSFGSSFNPNSVSICTRAQFNIDDP